MALHLLLLSFFYFFDRHEAVRAVSSQVLVTRELLLLVVLFVFFGFWFVFPYPVDATCKQTEGLLPNQSVSSWHAVVWWEEFCRDRRIHRVLP